MHAEQLLQLAAELCRMAPSLIEARTPIPEAASELYWTASQCRHQHWSREMKTYTIARVLGRQAASTLPVTSIVPICREILIAEVLCRVWGAVGCEIDQAAGSCDASPILRSVAQTHRAARHRALTLAVYECGLNLTESVALNRLRLRMERTTDLLLASMPTPVASREFAFDRKRLRRCAALVDAARRQRPHKWVDSVHAVSVTSIVSSADPSLGPSQEWNAKIATSIVGAWPPHLFVSSGITASRQQLRQLMATDDTAGELSTLQETSGDLAERWGISRPWRGSDRLI